MTENIEYSGRWLRVSTGGQDEASQLPDLVGWEQAHGYDVRAEYTVHGKSAYHGQQDQALDQVISDMEDGKISVLVVWASDRIERRGAYNAFDLARRVRDAGGRIEYVKDAYLNDTNDMSDVMLALAATRDHQESKRKSERIKIKQAALRAKGSVVGRPPWGYEIIEHDGIKSLRPTEAGRVYGPQIFQRVIDGQSLRDIAIWLDAEGVKTTQGKPWHEGFIGNRLIKNTVYYGQRVNAGALETEGIVSVTTWREANAALSSRNRPGRSAVKLPKALLKPVCGNAACDATGDGPSPMYRIKCGDSLYYRCTGSGAKRKGCGNMVRLDELDAWVMASMTADTHPHRERVFVPGDDRSDEIARAQELGAEAMRKGDYKSVAAHMAEAERLTELPSTPARWDTRDSDQSEADWFAALDQDGQRDYLARHAIKANVYGFTMTDDFGLVRVGGPN